LIRLHCDYLLIRTSDGSSIPCSAQLIVTQLVEESSHIVDPLLLEEAAKAAMHYFKHDLDRDCVTVDELATALERILRGFGLGIDSTPGPVPATPGPSDTPLSVTSIDLLALISSENSLLELGLYPRLRGHFISSLAQGPQRIVFHGLRPCVKQMLRAKRWGGRCQTLCDEIVAYLRSCLHAHPADPCPALVIL
jgi:hypothetical protein